MHDLFGPQTHRTHGQRDRGHEPASTEPGWRRCRRGRIWSPTSTCERSGTTAWSVFEASFYSVPARAVRPEHHASSCRSTPTLPSGTRCMITGPFLVQHGCGRLTTHPRHHEMRLVGG